MKRFKSEAHQQTCAALLADGVEPEWLAQIYEVPITAVLSLIGTEASQRAPTLRVGYQRPAHPASVITLDTEAFQATLVAVADGNILNLSGLAAEAAALVGVTPATMRATIYQRRLSDRHAEALRQALRHHVEDLKALL